MPEPDTLVADLDRLVERATGPLTDPAAAALRMDYLAWVGRAEEHLLGLGPRGAEKALRLQTPRLVVLSSDGLSSSSVTETVGAEARLQRRLWDAPGPRGSTPNRWPWLIDVVYGAVLTYAFQQIYVTLFQTLHSPAERARQGIVAGALLCFFLYDVTVYHFLVSGSPFRRTKLSTARYLLDIVMTFLLQLIIVSPARTPLGHAFFLAAGSLAAWHLCAAGWHLLASREYHLAAQAASYLPHLAMAAVYAVLVGLGDTSFRGLGSGRASAQPIGMYIVSALVIAFSAWRSRWLIKQHPPRTESVAATTAGGTSRS